MARSKVLKIAGLVLLLAGVGLFVFTRLSAAYGQRQVTQMMTDLERLLPERWSGVAAENTDAMPVLSLDGQDVVGVLEIPVYGVALPVGDQWSTAGITTHPCRFTGSLYDRDLVIGGVDRQGQLACLDVIEDGTAVTVTDMTGAVFSYTVARVERSKSAKAEVLVAEDYDLTLFVRDTYSLEYILVRCEME